LFLLIKNLLHFNLFETVNGKNPCVDHPQKVNASSILGEKRDGNCNKGRRKMAFTDVEVQEAHNAISEKPDGEDLNRLGLIYSSGEGRELDLVEAHKWFNLAAVLGYETAKTYRQEVSDQMDTRQIVKAQRAARKWLQGHHC
jgi:uncharacterized protein